jgi:hypothetical protein
MTDFIHPDQMDYYRDILDELCDIDHGLSSWEMDFLQTCSEWDGCFTATQGEKLDELYQRHC